MAITIVSTNLNVHGDNGNFETDPSTWVITPIGGTFARDITQKTKGLFSLRYTNSLPSSLFSFMTIAGSYAPTIQAGKKYKLTAKVRTSSTNPIAQEDCRITFENPLLPYLTSDVYKYVFEAIDNWVQIEGYFDSGGFSFNFYINVVAPSGDSLLPNVGGVLWVDEFEIYEYIETTDPVPEDPEAVKCYHSRNPITFEVVANDAYLAFENYRVRNEVLLRSYSGVYQNIFTADVPPDASKKCIFYLDPAFRGVLSAAPPDQNESTIVRLTDRIRMFKCRFGHLYQDMESPALYEESDVFCVALGGLSAIKFADVSFFESWLPASKRFLTWQPNGKDVDRLQEDYLFFFVYSIDITAIRQVVKAYFDDGTNQTIQSDVMAVSFRWILQLPAGPVNLSVSTVNPAKNVVRYETWLIDQADNVISEVRKYYITEFTEPFTRYVMFLNSLGGFDVIRLTGQKMEETNFDRTTIEKFLPADYNSADGQIQTSDVMYRDTYQYSTGFFTRNSLAWLEYIKDLFNSRDVYDITSGQRVPINIQSAKLQGPADKVYERFAQFEAIEAYVNKNFTPLSI